MYLAEHTKRLGRSTTTDLMTNSQPRKSPPALCGFSVRRTPRACHGACAHLRPGRLRASHAVCLRCSTLEPDFCARKDTDSESNSTTETIREQSLPMRGPLSNTEAIVVGSSVPSRRVFSTLRGEVSLSEHSRFHASFRNQPRSQSTPNKRR